MSNSNGSSVVYTPVVVDALPDSVIISVKPGTSIAAGQRLSLTAKVNNGSPVTGYQWLVNNVAVTGATSATYSSTTFNNNDAVSCNVTGLCGNLSSAGSTIVTVTNDGIQLTSSVTGELRVVPNPNKGIFTVKGSLDIAADQEVSLEITDVLGQVIYKHKVMALKGEVNEQIQLSTGVANGMYLMNVNTDTEHKVFHIVVEQ